MNVVFAGGVTGGHVAPGVALAEKVCSACPGSAVLFLSVANEVEHRMVAARGFPLEQIVRRRTGGAKAVFHAPRACLRARRRLASFRPDAVIGLGGYASLGAALAAITMRVPLVLLEQNIVPGRANRRLARWAARVCCQWESTVPRFPNCGQFTGSPVRTEILRTPAADRPRARRLFGLHPNLPTLLIMGGSQGAHPINSALAHAARALARRVQVIHLAGPDDQAMLQAEYAAAGLAAHVTTFLEAMDMAYAAADAALSRAGATSIAELAAAGLPAILVPYPLATDDHHRANALEAARQGWALLQDQDSLSPARIIELVATIVLDPTRHNTMRQAALAAARPDAADAILSVLQDVSAPVAPRASVVTGET